MARNKRISIYWEDPNGLVLTTNYTSFHVTDGSDAYRMTVG